MVRSYLECFEPVVYLGGGGGGTWVGVPSSGAVIPRVF